MLETPLFLSLGSVGGDDFLVRECMFSFHRPLFSFHRSCHSDLSPSCDLNRCNADQLMLHSTLLLFSFPCNILLYLYVRMYLVLLSSPLDDDDDGVTRQVEG